MAERRKATLQDIADKVGVSKMTVSAVLSNKASTVRVSATTRQRVMEIAQQMQYHPHAVARSLRRQCTNTIGLYSGYGYLDARNAFLSEIIGGLQEGCDWHHKDLLLHSVFRGRSAEDIYAELVDGRIDGLLVLAPPADPLLERLAESHLPAIAMTDAVSCLPSVVVDDAGGVRRLVHYLAERGHRHLIFCGMDEEMVSVMRRRQGLQEAAAEQGLRVTLCNQPRLQMQPDFTFLERLDAFPSPRPTAVLCWNDLTAYALLAHCRTRQIRVPETLAVAGFDGIPTLPGTICQITTLRAPWSEVARRSVALLVDWLKGATIPQETILPVELVLGDTA